MAAPAPRISERNLGAVLETTASTYGSAIRPFLQFCAEQGVPPLGGTAATVARYIAWQSLRGTVKAASLQPYLSAINGFYRDHGAEPVAQGDLISKVRKGLAASQVEPDPPGVRTDVPARLITRTLRLAETLREELGPTWTRDQLPRILLFRAAMAVVAMYIFYARGKTGVACQTGDLTVTADVYCGQRGLPAARWVVTHDEPAASWTSATVTDWLQLVAHMLEEHPPPGFVWTSHSLRKGAATAAYAIGVVLQKIKHFGGWAQLSSIVLDYINPTALPCAASWQLFGWLTPWGATGMDDDDFLADEENEEQVGPEGGKKAADPTKATPADSVAETPAERTETTRDTTTLVLLQALALKVDALSTRVDEQDNNKHKEQRDIPSDDDEVGERVRDVHVDDYNITVQVYREKGRAG
eukprot:jgi/Tetstr1/433926/TSEL_023103.t1